jgi:hypothetical protein
MQKDKKNDSVTRASNVKKFSENYVMIATNFRNMSINQNMLRVALEIRSERRPNVVSEETVWYTCSGIWAINYVSLDIKSLKNVLRA